MGSQSYSALVLLLYFRNIDRELIPSMQDVIHYADRLGKKLKINVNVTLQTKYHVINDMIDKGILECKWIHGHKQVNLSERVKNYINEEFTIKVEDKYEEAKRKHF